MTYRKILQLTDLIRILRTIITEQHLARSYNLSVSNIICVMVSHSNVYTEQMFNNY